MLRCRHYDAIRYRCRLLSSPLLPYADYFRHYAFAVAITPPLLTLTLLPHADFRCFRFRLPIFRRRHFRRHAAAAFQRHAAVFAAATFRRHADAAMMMPRQIFDYCRITLIFSLSFADTIFIFTPLPSICDFSAAADAICFR